MKQQIELIAKRVVFTLFPPLRAIRRKRHFQALYDYVAECSLGKYFPLMNYGYSLQEDDRSMPTLDERDQPWDFMFQLYHRVATQVQIEDKDVLEIGCGHGGGSYYLKHYLRANSVKAIDISKRNIHYCISTFEAPGLNFQDGDAERIPFADNHFDCVVNVESSHCYPNLYKFMSEVKRVLKPGGHFLYADHRSLETLDVMSGTLEKSGLQIVSKADITKPVAESLMVSHDRKRDIVEALADSDLYSYARIANWAALKDTQFYDNIVSGAQRYFCFCAKKPGISR